MKTKVCNKCKLEKDISKNYAIKTNGSPRSECRKCEALWQKQYRQNNPEKLRAWESKRRQVPKRRFETAKRNAVTREINWELSYEDFLQLIDQDCYYCSFLIGEKVTTGSGLDRIDNSKGYELSNVVPCCGSCNIIRNALLSPEELKIAIQAILNYRQQKKNL